jgi:threonine/homoserine/homoserine lactone efflux protein
MQSYLLFAGAFLISVATPGPDVAVVISRALALRSAVRCVPMIVGIVAGKLLLLIAALLGISALAAALGTLFIAVKLAGAAYLAYLGVRMWNRPPRDEIGLSIGAAGPLREAALGLAMSLGNPLAILFYLALLPNVIDVGHATPATGAILIAIVIGCSVAVYFAYAFLAGRFGALFRSSSAQRRVNRTASTTMIGAAVLVAIR